MVLENDTWQVQNRDFTSYVPGRAAREGGCRGVEPRQNPNSGDSAHADLGQDRLPCFIRSRKNPALPGQRSPFPTLI